MLGSFLLQCKLCFSDREAFLHLSPRILAAMLIVSRKTIITHYTGESDKKKKKHEDCASWE